MFEGIFTALITPMHEDTRIDWTAWESHLERQIAGGAHGLVIGGSTGEFYALSQSERRQQFARAGKVIQGRRPWLAGVNDFTTAAVCDYARAARDAGATGLLLGAPPYAVPNSRELARHCLTVSQTAALPIVLYNYPARTGSMMDDEFFSLIEHDVHFVAVKESSGDIKRIQALVQRFPNIKLCCGIEDLALDFFAWGARMWVCAASNAALAPCVALYEACVIKRDFEEGRKLMMALLPLLHALENNGKFLPSIKRATASQGGFGTMVRPPITDLSAHEATQIDALLRDLARALDQRG